MAERYAFQEESMPTSLPDPKKKRELWSPQQWGGIILYFILTLGMLWVWQEAARQVKYRTIPYSEFKDDLKRGEVVECWVEQSDIQGKIQPRVSESEQKGAESVSPSNTLAPQQAVRSSPKTPESKAVSDAKAAQAPKPQTSTPYQLLNTPRAWIKPNEPSGQTKASAAFLFRTVRVEDPDLVRDLENAGVKFTGVRPGFMSEFLWAWALPIGLMVLLWWFLSRGMRGLGQSVMRFGSSGAKLVADQDTNVTFNDVAGCDEAKYELQEVVNFLKQPERYRALGAKIPKGVLLVGPPGTGKTLLARAVAGEAKVPFFSISGSEFVEMFVGVGAARVRDLFQQAKGHAPCIVFIDELDAVGRQRGVHIGAVNDEREQTLNQLLVGLDGFDANVGVVVLAATNRPDVLDRALLRPGRFDRQIVVDAPDLEGRNAILRLHSRGKPMAPDVDLRKVAQETPGFSGADLANLINEAALLTARHGGKAIGQKDLEDAAEKVVAGPERKSRRMTAEDKRRVAYHESGHALVTAYSKHADVVHKISIVPRGRAALGYTLQLPENDQYLMTQAELIDKIKGMLGGRAAEEVVFNEITTGAENDLEHATAVARQMICLYGMGKSIGLVHCGQQPNPFLPLAGDGMMQRDCSEETADAIDQEVRKILDGAYAESKQILQQHRDQLDLVAGELLKHETLDAQTFRRLISQPAA
jgi:cell division protease FtsH